LKSSPTACFGLPKTTSRELSDCVKARDQGLSPLTIVIDNARVHSNIENIIQHQDVKILRLAPYSYLLNPIEKVWSIFKAEVKKLLIIEKQEILQYVRNGGNLTILEFRLQKLEQIAARAKLQCEKIISCCFFVEKYYQSVIELDDLIELT